MQVRKLSYLAIDRLGELLGLTADALSPIHDLQSAILGLKKAMPSELKEGLDAQLLAEGLLSEEAEGLQPTASMKLFISALYCPKKCYRVRMQEKDGTGDTYLLLMDGAWLRIDAFRGELTVSGPFDTATTELYLRASVETALRGTDIQLHNDDSTNHGIFFDASDDRWAIAHLVSKHNNIQGGKPVMCVQYVNNKGLEDYWTFTEQNLGGGTGYVNNYTGNLVVNIPICDTGSASLPAGISYYYNGYQAGKHFAITQGGGEYEASKSLCGAGWKTTVDERIAYLTPGKGNNDDLHKQGIKYTYTDADGTVLYMQEKKDNNEKVIPNTFEDELGKGYTLKIRTEGGWELTDKQNNKKIFTGGGRLWMVQSNQSQDKIVYRRLRVQQRMPLIHHQRRVHKGRCKSEQIYPSGY